MRPQAEAQIGAEELYHERTTLSSPWHRAAVGRISPSAETQIVPLPRWNPCVEEVDTRSGRFRQPSARTLMTKKSRYTHATYGHHGEFLGGVLKPSVTMLFRGRGSSAANRTTMASMADVDAAYATAVIRVSGTFSAILICLTSRRKFLRDTVLHRTRRCGAARVRFGFGPRRARGSPPLLLGAGGLLEPERRTSVVIAPIP